MQQPDEMITIVSGLPRSGTSMMMKMLEAGGMNVVTDNIRKADKDNPKGYYEFEQAKKIKEDISWLPATQGNAFKMVSMLLMHLPSQYNYQILFMERNMQEVLASQNKMLERHGKKSTVSDDKLSQLYEKHLHQIKEYLHDKDYVRVLYVSYANVISSPREEALRVNKFLAKQMDAETMANVVDNTLYRNRTTSGEAKK